MMFSYKTRGGWLLAFLVAGLVFLASVLPAMAAVTVYAEGAYTDSDLVVYVYADIDTDAICSAGVKLSYDNAVLTVASAEKNDAVWFMGDGSTNHPYMNPENAGDGVIIICGKLDTAAPTAGVIGDRVLLGKVSFTRNDGGATPTDPTVAEQYFGISVELGRGGDFANFVTTTGTELDDSVDFSTVGAIVRERGDANADGIINFQDMLFVKNFTQTGGVLSIYMDCNNDGILNFQDMLCVKAITQQ